MPLQIKGDCVMKILAKGWTVERIAALTDDKLEQLLRNAQTRLALAQMKLDPERALSDLQNLIDACDVAMQARRLMSPAVRDLHQDADAKLTNFGIAMLARFDLSKENAAADAKKAGVTRFYAHDLLSANGRSKVGGWQQSGAVQIDRYISYREKDAVIRLACILHCGDPASAARWYVLAPKDMVEGWASLSSLDRRFASTSLIADESNAKVDGGLKFRDFNEARKLFEDVISRCESVQLREQAAGAGVTV